MHSKFLPWPIIALGAVSLLSACGAKPATSAADPSLPVDVAVFQGDAATDVVRLPASVLRDREARLSFRAGGAITALPIRIGEPLAAGQLVAALDPTPFVSARIRAEAEVERLTREAGRYTALIDAGAISEAQRLDSQSALRAAQAALASARYDEQSARITAPFAGVVLNRQAEAGEVVAAGQVVATVADLKSSLLARVAVPQALAATLKLGDAVRFQGPDGGRDLAAHVLRIGGLSDARTGAVDVDLALPKDANLPSGAIGAALITDPAARTRAGGPLPAEALINAKDGQAEVFVLDPQRSVARRTRVRFLGFEGDNARVAGLAPGAKVITAGAGFVADGQSVQVAGQ